MDQAGTRIPLYYTSGRVECMTDSLYIGGRVGEDI